MTSVNFAKNDHDAATSGVDAFFLGVGPAENADAADTARLLQLRLDNGILFFTLDAIHAGIVRDLVHADVVRGDWGAANSVWFNFGNRVALRTWRVVWDHAVRVECVLMSNMMPGKSAFAIRAHSLTLVGSLTHRWFRDFKRADGRVPEAGPNLLVDDPRNVTATVWTVDRVAATHDTSWPRMTDMEHEYVTALATGVLQEVGEYTRTLVTVADNKMRTHEGGAFSARTVDPEALLRSTATRA